MASSDGRNPTGQVVSAQRVRESGRHITVPVPGHDTCDEPVVELVREGDVIRAIDITCPCGRRFRVLCDYQRSEEA